MSNHNNDVSVPCPIIHGKILPEIFHEITKTISHSEKFYFARRSLPKWLAVTEVLSSGRKRSDLVNASNSTSVCTWHR